MEKMCIFCGNIPLEKTKEHIIPKWLLEVTGDPNRKAFFGFDLNNSKPKQRIYAFDHFTFPACDACNNEFSDLEGIVKNVILSILQEKEINDIDVSHLFDWLDKVRIGLWLGFNILNNFNSGIIPKFHIKTRICKYDRLLFIYKLSTNRNGINFVGADSPSFHYIPSCFALIINNFCLFNVSCFNLCSRRLGFPFPKEAYYRNIKLEIEADIVEGLNRIFFPIIQKEYLSNACKFYQPIFPSYPNDNELRHMYDKDYVQSHSIKWEEGIGSVFYETNSKAHVFPRNKTNNWIPQHEQNLKDFLLQINKQVYEFQIFTAKELVSINKLNKEDKNTINKHLDFYKRCNKIVIDFIKDQVNRLEL